MFVQGDQFGVQKLPLFWEKRPENSCDKIGLPKNHCLALVSLFKDSKKELEYTLKQ